jgi:mannose-1-phosphate guanylyltransferase
MIILLTVSIFTITLSYVKSHQDKNKLWVEMTKEEYMNTVADDLTHKAHSLPRQKIYHPLPSNTVNFIINDRCINYP